MNQCLASWGLCGSVSHSHPILQTTPQEGEVNLDLCKQREDNVVSPSCPSSSSLYFGRGRTGASKNIPSEVPPLETWGVAQVIFMDNVFRFHTLYLPVCWEAGQIGTVESLIPFLQRWKSQPLGCSTLLVVEVAWEPRFSDSKVSDLFRTVWMVFPLKGWTCVCIQLSRTTQGYLC